MKNSNLIRRFDVVAVGRDLKLRVVDSNGRVRLIELEGNERVEVGSGSSYQPSADDKCSVCLEEMQGQVLQLRGCGHVFHSRCLKLVFLNKGICCPVCRQTAQMSPADIQCNRCVVESNEIFNVEDLTISPCGHVHRKSCNGDYIMALFNKDATKFTQGNLQEFESRPFAKCYFCAHTGVTSATWVEVVAKQVEFQSVRNNEQGGARQRIPVIARGGNQGGNRFSGGGGHTEHSHTQQQREPGEIMDVEDEYEEHL